MIRQYFSGMSLFSAVLFALTVLALSENAFADGTPKRAPIDELMVKSGLWVQLGNTEPALKGLVIQASKQNAQMTPELARGILNAFSKVFSADSLRSRFLERLPRKLSDDQVSEILTFLNSDLGKRMTALDEKNSEPTEQLAAEALASDYFKKVPSARKDEIAKFAKLLHLDEFAADLYINGQLGIANGLALSLPSKERMDPVATQKNIEAVRPTLIAMLGERNLARLAYAYRDLSDADLADFNRFASSAIGKHYHLATMSIFREVLGEAALNVGFELGGGAIRRDRN